MKYLSLFRSVIDFLITIKNLLFHVSFNKNIYIQRVYIYTFRCTICFVINVRVNISYLLTVTGNMNKVEKNK